MATYSLLNGNITNSDILTHTINVRHLGRDVLSLWFMVQKAIKDFPHNEAPPQNINDVWLHNRGLRIRFNEEADNWEGNAVAGPYRLDFQGFTQDHNYANWQIQFGVGQQNGGTAAHVLLKLNHTFSSGQFAEALKKSALNLQTCRLEP